MTLLWLWLIKTIAVLLAAALVPGFQVKGFWNAVVVAALVGVLNTFLGWVIFIFLGLVTLGLGFLLFFITSWVTNAIVLKIADAITDRLTIRGFGAALMAALVISVASTVAQWIFGPHRYGHFRAAW